MTINRPVIILGAGGHAKVLISSLKTLQREIIGILSPEEIRLGQSIAGICIIGDDDKIFEYSIDSIELVNGLGSVSSPEKRKDIYMKFKKAGYSFASVIHPTAILTNNIQLGEGVQIMAGAIVQTECVIGDNILINTGAVVDHDCKIGSHSHIAPGAVLSGGVEVGAMSHIGPAATIIQGIKIGFGAVIGAGAVVITDVPHGQKVVGNPAK